MRAIEDKIDIRIKKDNIIDGIMKSKGLYCLVSNAKVGKSMLALQLSNSITNGEQFLKHNVMSSPVLYISTESDFIQLKERAKMLNLNFPKDSFFIVDRNGKSKVSIFDFESDIKKFSYKNGKLVIIDMLKDTDLGIDYDINSYQDIGQKLLPKLRSLCEQYGVSILFTHHLNKRGAILGSTAFDAVVDGKLTLIENKNDKSLVKLNIINRDFPELDIQLKKSSNQIFSVIEDKEEDEELNYNLIEIIKYVSKTENCEFTCTDIINKLDLKITARSLGRLLNSKSELLKKEGLYLTEKRTGNARLYVARYKEPLEEN